MSETKKIGYKDIFRQKEYMKMIIAALINRFGDSVDAIASAWIVYEITNNAAWSAIMYGVNRIPSIVVTPLAGAWVEGRNKKRIMVVTDIMRAICVAIVATGYWLGFLNVGILLATTVAISTVEAFRGPANTALTPKILEKEYYEHGMALMSTLCSVVELIGMGIAASIIALIGTAGAIYVDMVTFIFSALIILTVNTKEQELKKQKFNAKEYMVTLKDGFSYARKEKVVLFFCGIVIYLNAVLVPLNSLQAPLAGEILGGGAEILSILGIAVTIGMMLGTLIYPLLSSFFSAKGYLILCCTGIGLYYVGFVVCKPIYDTEWLMYGYVAVASFLCGAVVSVFNTFLNVELIKMIKEEYLARAASIMSSLSVISVPVVSFIISAVTAMVSTEWLFIIAGVLAAIAGPCFLNSKAMKEQSTEDAPIESEIGQELGA